MGSMELQSCDKRWLYMGGDGTPCLMSDVNVLVDDL